MYSVTVEDEATPWLQWAMTEFPDFRRKALKSLGWYMQKEIKKGIKSRAPGGRAYAPFLPAKVRRKLDEAFDKKGKRSYAPLGGLAKAVGYQYKSSGDVVVGWLSESAVRLGTKQEKGAKVRITGKMRRAYLAAGIGIKPGRKEVVIPARPTIEPMSDVLVPKAAGYVEGKIWGYLTKGSPINVPKSRRKYVVRG